jgi:hypothetical protein
VNCSATFSGPTRDLPERGRIKIFNRSNYEEVLIARVHPEILLGEGIPEAPKSDKRVKVANSSGNQNCGAFEAACAEIGEGLIGLF